MPAILSELIELLLSAKESESVMEGLTSMTKTFMGNRSKLLKKAIKSMSGSQEISMRKALGDHLTDRVKQHFNVKENRKAIKEFDVSGHSTWVRTLSWSPILGTLSLTVQEGKRQNNPYKLPFFPRSAVVAIQGGADPGKTIWRKYWRVVGKGKFHNKAKNVFKVKATKKVVSVINKGIPSIKIPKVTQKKAFNKNILKRVQVKTSNIPKTGAKGIKITVKAPKIRKY